MKAPEQHVLQQPRPCSWVSVSVDVDRGVHVVMVFIFVVVTMVVMAIMTVKSGVMVDHH